MSRSRALIALAGLAASGAASASILIEHGSMPLTTTNYSTPIFVMQFDPTLGTLESVDIVANVGYAGRHYGENMSAASAATYLSRLTYNVTLNGQGLAGPVTAADVNETSGSLSIADGTVDFGGASGYTVNFNDAGQGLATLTNVVDFSPFIGVGSVLYTLSASATSFHQASGGVVAQGTMSLASGEITVTYHYTAIPAPGGALALAGLTLITRRRR